MTCILRSFMYKGGAHLACGDVGISPYRRLSGEREPSAPYALRDGDTFHVGDHAVTICATPATTTVLESATVITLIGREAPIEMDGMRNSARRDICQ